MARRITLRILSIAAISTILLAAPVTAGEQAKRALASVRQLVDSGQVTADVALRLVVKQGNIAAFLGQGFELQNEWERKTGILIDAQVMPQRDSFEMIRDGSEADITIARVHEYPDLVHDDLIINLTPFFQRYGFDLPDDEESGYIMARQQAYFDDRTVAIPADCDVTILYLRKDLLEDEENKLRFRERYGRELSAPRTWEDYRQLAEFFHRPESGLYGALEQRDPATGWMFWLPRYASQANPYQPLFDEQMHPLIDSPAGIAATESYLATIPFSPPEILQPGNDYTYTLPLFMQGKGFSTIITIAAAKLFNLQSSSIRDKFMTAILPGTIVENRLVRRSAMIYGNNIVIPTTSNHPELAFFYAMWLTDPDVSTRMVGVPGGFVDPFRFNHFQAQRVGQIYTPQALSDFRAVIDTTVPAGTGLPGNAEYIAALNRNLALAANGKMSVVQAMRQCAQEWEAITESYGRESQIDYWKSFSRSYPDIANDIQSL